MFDKLKGVFSKKRKHSEKDHEEEKHTQGDDHSTQISGITKISIPEK